MNLQPVGDTSRKAFPWEQFAAVTKLYPTGGVGVIQDDANHGLANPMFAGHFEESRFNLSGRPEGAQARAQSQNA